MAPPTNLAGAARQCGLDLTTRYLNNSHSSYAASVKAFLDACNATGLFDNNTLNDRPMINWISACYATALDILAANANISNDKYDAFQLLESMIQKMYRFLSLGYWMNTTAAGLISNTQAAAILTAYNANISTT